jgi:recombinational DNA repair ATPase RecF
MKIHTVTAHAFGPFAGETLELAPGMTIIRGLNEAGKSSWHAATYAALCGMRRGRGRRRAEDQEFADRHEPWDGDSWDVSCEDELPGGRRYELRHDLSGRIDCSARDLILGNDVSDEIIFEGAPDGSRWLGIDRRIFLAVACVRQAEILGVTQNATTLQETLQRAAATAGTQETAATALAVIAEFRREAVGLRRANSNRPLQAAIERSSEAKELRDLAVTEHDGWLIEQVQASSRDDQAREAEARLHAAVWESHRRRVEALTTRHAEAVQLAERYPMPPPDLADDDSVSDLVANAVRSWEERPAATVPARPTAVELRRELDALPTMPVGDVEPHESTESAARQLEDVVRRRDEHELRRPQSAPVAVADGWSEQLLRGLARELDVVVPPVDEALKAEVERLRGPASSGEANLRRPLLIGGGVIAAAGVIAVAFSATALGVALLVLGAIAAAAGGWTSFRNPSSSRDDGALRAAETRLVVAEQMHASAQAQLDGAKRRAHNAGLPTDATELGALADLAFEAERASANTQAWAEERARLVTQLDDARNGLRQALTHRSVTVAPDASDADLEVAYADYRRACRERREASAVAARRPDLEQTLAARQAEEDRYAADIERLEAAAGRLREAVLAARLDDSDAGSSPDETVVALRQWLDDRTERRSSTQHERRGWDRLQTLLDGRTVDELRVELGRSVERFEAMAVPEAPARADHEDDGDDLEDVVQQLRAAAQSARQRATSSASEVRVRAERLRSVPEAEEELVAAGQELARLERLEATLDQTAVFLETAQGRVHRDIAPVLQTKVRERLARVTAGRYSDVIIDPEDLDVQVRDANGFWRDASRLSHGTAEQIYLLLRIAIAEIFTSDGANCPLLLDDVTVQSDPVRTCAVLDVLHEASADHQIILFSQEVVVGEWAESNLTERDVLLTL